MSPLFGTKYDEEEIIEVVNRALVNAPRVDATAVQPVVEGGVITLAGTVPNQVIKEHAIDAVRTALDSAGVAYERIEDNIST